MFNSTMCFFTFRDAEWSRRLCNWSPASHSISRLLWNQQADDVQADAQINLTMLHALNDSHRHLRKHFKFEFSNRPVVTLRLCSFRHYSPSCDTPDTSHRKCSELCKKVNLINQKTDFSWHYISGGTNNRYIKNKRINKMLWQIKGHNPGYTSVLSCLQ